EPGRFGEIQEVVVLLFRQPLPSGLDGALYASVFALDRLRDVHAAELLDRVIADALAERQLPGLREGADHARVVGANRLALRARRALAARAVEVAESLGVGDRRGVDVGNIRHGSSLEARLGRRGPSPAVRRLALPHALAAEAALPARDHFLVVDVVGNLAPEGGQDRLGRPGDAGAQAAAGVVGHHVRREQDAVAEIAQLAVERQRLLLAHVERGAADLALQERLDQGRLVHARAA